VADESDLEKTEAASPRRLEKAREEGRIARSRELATFALLAAGFGGVWGLSGTIGAHLTQMLRGAFTFDHAAAFDTSRMMLGAGAASREGFAALAPILALTGVAALASPLALGGWLLTTTPLAPNFSRLNPITGIGRMFSINTSIQLGMALGKTLLVGGITANVIWRHKDEVLALATQPLVPALAKTMHLIALCCLTAVGALLLIAAVDVPYQMWQHAKKLRMTKEEVKREHRESEGDPHVKGRIRQQQRAMARRRMMAAIPKADVVVTNPTHFAVALQYAEGEMRAPKVVAKGKNLIALKIREIAAEHRVPLLEAPPLARALYHNVKLEQEIPGALYGAVAEVLAWVYQLRRFADEGGMAPVAPTELDVPAELDKHLHDALAADDLGEPDEAAAANGTDGARRAAATAGGATNGDDASANRATDNGGRA
jgi:flagellar biosynthetic protein FlhB